MTDGQKSTDAYARWAKSDEGVQCLNGETLGLPKPQYVYLRNRLWLAFQAGVIAGGVTENPGLAKETGRD